MYKQVLDPVSNSLFLSSLFALIPLATLFILLGGLRLKAPIAAGFALLASILVAIIVYSMPAWRAPRSACSRSCGSSGTPSGSST